MNMMTYPSAEAEFSQGLRDGIQTGLAMRKQQQDEKTAEFQKQKYEEQQNQLKIFKQIEQNSDLLKTPGVARDTKVKLWNDNRRLKMELGGSDIGEITEWNDAAHQKLANDLSNIYALTKKKENPLSFTEAEEQMNARIMQAYSDGELTKEERAEIGDIAKQAKTMVEPEVEAENFSMGMAAKEYPEDPSASGYFAKGGKAGEKALEAMAKPEKEFSQTKDIHIGGGKFQTMGFNPATNTYDKPIGQPFTAEDKKPAAEKVTDFVRKWAKAQKIAADKVKRQPTEEEVADVFKSKFGSFDLMQFLLGSSQGTQGKTEPKF